MQPNGITDLPPIAYPTVTISGRELVVKFNQLAEYFVSLWGYEMANLITVLSPQNTDPRRGAFIFQLFAACVGHNFTSAVPAQKPPTAEQWMEILPDDDPDLITNIGKAVILALVKHWSDREKKRKAKEALAAAPTPTTDAPAAPPVN